MNHSSVDQLSEVSFGRFFDLASDLMCVLDGEGHYLRVNSAFEQTLGYGMDALRDRPFTSLARPEDQAQIQAQLDRLAAGEPSVRFIGQYRSKATQLYRLEWAISAADRAASLGKLYCVARDVTQQMQTLAQYQLIADRAIDVISRQTVEGDYLYVSPACYEILGYRPEEMVGHNRYEFIHPDDVDLLKERVSQAKAAGERLAICFRARHQQGHYVWMEALHRQLQPRAAQSAEVIVVTREVTARKAAEAKTQAFNQTLETRVQQRTQALSAAEEKNASLLQTEREASLRAAASEIKAQLYVNATQNMPVGLHIWQLEQPLDPNSLRMLTANPITVEFTGIPTQSIVGKTILEAFPALAGTDIPGRYAEVARSGQEQDLGEVVYGDDRVESSIFTVKAFPLPDRCVGIVFENITLQKQAEVLRQEQEAQLQVMFEQANVGMARVAPDGRWVQVNHYLCNLLGYSADELTQKTFVDVTDPADKDKDWALYEQMLEGNRIQAEITQRLVTQQGDTVWTLTTASTIRNSAGELLYFIVAIQDITHQKESEAILKAQKDNLLATNLMLTHTMRTLEQRNEELDQFAYVTSHDLKAPLRAIANLATWIEEDLGDRLPADNVEQFELLKSRVHRMEGLINGLLEYSRIGRTQQSSEQVNVASLLADTIDSLPSDQFKIEIAPEMPTFPAKRAPLLQVFSNLIDNAIKHHNREGGLIEIGVEDLGAFYEFTVKDDGPGIAAPFHEKVFTIFQTLRSRDEFESTGIGLSLVKKTVLAEGGEIRLISKPDQGAAFIFTWPKLPHTTDEYIV